MTDKLTPTEIIRLGIAAGHEPDVILASLEAGGYRIVTDDDWDKQHAVGYREGSLRAKARQAPPRSPENRIASEEEEAALSDYEERIARALHEAHKPYCDYTYPFEHPMSSAHVYRALARAVTRVAPQVPSPGRGGEK
jgi:hypothetical protein